MRPSAVRSVARTLAAAAGAMALMAGSPGPAQAATEYDGDATALRVEGLRLEVFPQGLDGAPGRLKPLVDALRELQSQAPQELQRDHLSLVMPDQVIGHAEYPGVDTQGAIPENPLLTADVLPARSVRLKNGDLLSEAGVADLSLGGGVLSADLVKTSCSGDGDTVSLDVSQLQLSSNQHVVRSEVDLKPGTAVPIAGIGAITFNQQDTDGTTYAEGTNVVIDLDSDLSVDALLGLFDSTVPAVRKALEQVLLQIGDTRFGPGGEQPLKPIFNRGNLGQIPTDQFEAGARQLADQARQGSRQMPREAREALNNVAHLGGTVTIANAACAQATTTSASRPQAPHAAPVQPAANTTSQPPLADTGSPAGMLGMGVAGLAALAGGLVVLAHLRRRGPVVRGQGERP
jgi:hypothetical protein